MIVTFYSFKGGVGRSMALANVANWLRLQRLRVAVIDWDLEAPGLECFFAEDAEKRAEVREAPGLIDLLMSYQERYNSLPAEFFAEQSDANSSEAAAEAAHTPGVTAADSAFLARRVEILTRVLPPLTSLTIPLVPSKQGDGLRGAAIQLLTPGMREGDKKYAYARDVQAFAWNDFYESYDGEAFFAWMRQELDKHFDVTLIDSRTGMTEVGGVCTREMPSLVVAVCAANHQNLEGTELFVRSLLTDGLKKARRGRPLKVSLLPARYDNGENDLLLEFYRRFAELIRRIGYDHQGEVWAGLDAAAAWDMRVPYTPKYAYKETLCVGASDANADLAAQYAKLARFIAREFLGSLSGAEREKLALASPDLQALAREFTALDTSLDATLEAAVASLPESARRLLLPILLRFVGFADRTDRHSLVLKRRPLAEFGAELRPHVDELIKARILAVELDDSADPYLRLGKNKNEEFLRFPYANALTEWRRLREFTNSSLEFLYFRSEVQAGHASYEQSGREPRALANQTLLKAAERFAERLPHELSDAEREYLAASAAQMELRAVTLEVPALPTPAVLAKPFKAELPVSAGYVNPASVTLSTGVDSRPFPSAMSAELTRTKSILWVIAGGVLVTAAALAWFFVRGKADDLMVLPGPPLASGAVVKPSTETLAAEALNKGLREEWAGNLGGALEQYAAAIALNSRSKDAYLARGSLYLKQEKFDSAALDLARAVELDPTDSAALFALGKARFANGLVDEAIGNYEKSLTNDNKNAEVYYALATARRTQGQLDQSIDAYGKALELKTNFMDARYDRALAYLQAGNKPAAIVDLERVSTQTENTTLQANAIAKLGEQGIISNTSRKPNSASIFFQYVDPADRDLVKEVQGSISPKLGRVVAAQLAPPRTQGDIRFVKEDQEVALSIKREVEMELKAHGTLLALETVVLDPAKFPKAQRGNIEVWLPSLSKQQRISPAPSTLPVQQNLRPIAPPIKGAINPTKLDKPTATPGLDKQKDQPRLDY